MNGDQKISWPPLLMLTFRFRILFFPSGGMRCAIKRMGRERIRRRAGCQTISIITRQDTKRGGRKFSGEQVIFAKSASAMAAWIKTDYR